MSGYRTIPDSSRNRPAFSVGDVVAVVDKARREPKIYQINQSAVLPSSDTVIIWLLVTVDERLVVERLEPCDHLLR